MPNCPHCETPLDEHEANRCLDAWVATLAGWTFVGLWDNDDASEWVGDNPETGFLKGIPHYSADINTAMGLLLGLPDEYEWGISKLHGRISCQIIRMVEGEVAWHEDKAATPSEAICRAFIAAKGTNDASNSD